VVAAVDAVGLDDADAGAAAAANAMRAPAVIHVFLNRPFMAALTSPWCVTWQPSYLTPRETPSFASPPRNGFALFSL
jgi:hypothetical protein